MWWQLAQAAFTVASQAAQRQQQQAMVQQQQQQQALESQMMWRQHETQARQQRDLLKRQLASSRAAFAGGGIGMSGGSGAALAAGMAKDAETALADRYDLLSLQHEGRSPQAPQRSDLARGLEIKRDAEELMGVMRPIFMQD